MKTPFPRGIYAITDCQNLTDQALIEKTEKILSVGISLLQYRNKETEFEKKINLAIQIQALCTQYKTPFIVNDDLRLAQAISADGIHLGKHDENIDNAREILGNKIIGISCYNDMQRALEAEKKGADYVAFGAFFPSPTKPDTATAGLELLSKSKQRLNIPVAAIGGITTENGGALVEAKADLLAVISALYSADDVIKTTREFNQLF